MIDYEFGLPARMARLPRDPHGRPVPFFVEWVEGKPDFRIIDGRKLKSAIERRLCWACGEELGGYKAFVIGPMCAINRNTAEPPCHRDCAMYCASHCDFLVSPERGRRGRFMPEGVTLPAGEAIMRNPGVTLVWITKNYRLAPDENGGVLFKLGEPAEVYWYTRGRAADREEVMASIASGLPLLLQKAEEQGPEAVEVLEAYKERAMPLLPTQ